LNHPPILIVGVDRSGTTLLNLILDSHSRIAIPYESKFFIRYYLGMSEFGDLSSPESRKILAADILNEPTVKQWDIVPSIDDIDLDECTTLSKTITSIYEAYARARGKDIWGDKTPSYINRLDVLYRLFPDARFIHIIRDGRDVALSIMKQWWGPNDFANALRYWESRVSCARKMLNMLPGHSVFELNFEKLVSDPHNTIKQLTDFLGLEYEAQMLNDYTSHSKDKVGDRINTIHTHLRDTPKSDQAYKWKTKLCPADQALAFEIAGSTLTDCGYDPGVKHHKFKIVREIYHRIRGSLAWRFTKQETQ
jgi:hypothetical protein